MTNSGAWDETLGREPERRAVGRRSHYEAGLRKLKAVQKAIDEYHSWMPGRNAVDDLRLYYTLEDLERDDELKIPADKAIVEIFERGLTSELDPKGAEMVGQFQYDTLTDFIEKQGYLAGQEECFIAVVSNGTHTEYVLKDPAGTAIARAEYTREGFHYLQTLTNPEREE